MQFFQRKSGVTSVIKIYFKWKNMLINFGALFLKMYIFKVVTFFSRLVVINFFFYLGFLSRTFMIHRTAGEGGGPLFNSSPPLPPAPQTFRH